MIFEFWNLKWLKFEMIVVRWLLWFFFFWYSGAESRLSFFFKKVSSSFKFQVFVKMPVLPPPRQEHLADSHVCADGAKATVLSRRWQRLSVPGHHESWVCTLHSLCTRTDPYIIQSYNYFSFPIPRPDSGQRPRPAPCWVEQWPPSAEEPGVGSPWRLHPVLVEVATVPDLPPALERLIFRLAGVRAERFIFYINKFNVYNIHWWYTLTCFCFLIWYWTGWLDSDSIFLIVCFFH